MGIFSGAGQGCVCGPRVFVQRSVFDQVVAGIAGVADKLSLGGPQDEGAQIGPLISEKQLGRVLGLPRRGQATGIEMVAGGERADRKGWFVKPTVVANVPTDARLYREEIFGPVVTVLPFDDEVRRSGWPTTPRTALPVPCTRVMSAAHHRLARRIQAGTITVNCQLTFDHQMPFGGYKQSGWGHEFGKDGIETYFQTKSVYNQL